MPFSRLPITEASQTADARRRAKNLALQKGFDETAVEKVAIVATEAATNLLKHAGGGEILLGTSCREGVCSIDLLALDRGPGMSETACRKDGFSTTQTPGNGLGAMTRLSAFFDIYSRPGAGTVVFAQISKNGAPAVPNARVHGIQFAKPGEDVCGDQWLVQDHRGGLTILVADGLGHGLDARLAARAAVEAMRESPDLGPKDLVQRMHESMRHTRGAAVGVAELDQERRIATFSGLGNISARIFESGAPVRNMVSTNGTAGVEARVLREFSYPWPKGSVVVLHSDGLSARWDLADYPGLWTRDPGVIAGVLMRDHCRHTDDATVVVVK